MDPGYIFHYDIWTPGESIYHTRRPFPIAKYRPRDPFFAMRNGPWVHILGGPFYHITLALWIKIVRKAYVTSGSHRIWTTAYHSIANGIMEHFYQHHKTSFHWNLIQILTNVQILHLQLRNWSMELPWDYRVNTLLHLRMMAVLIHLFMLLSSSWQFSRYKQYQHIEKYILPKIYQTVYLSEHDAVFRLLMMDLTKYSTSNQSYSVEVGIKSETVSLDRLNSSFWISFANTGNNTYH